jgi:hypothetical protein
LLLPHLIFLKLKKNREAAFSTLFEFLQRQDIEKDRITEWGNFICFLNSADLKTRILTKFCLVAALSSVLTGKVMTDYRQKIMRKNEE